MASRNSGDWLRETYQGTWRGRANYGDIGWDMFPEKTERTDIEEEPIDDQLQGEWRGVLKDTGPEKPGFEYEEPRRNTMARSHLNLRDGGVFGSTTDPYKSEDYDTQFHDHDPRGWNTEQPWDEYRRVAEGVLRRTDFKDDGDYSTTSGGIHPNTMYQNIRSAQDWVKARLKIFDTSFDNMQHGGVGIYPEVSKVNKSTREWGTVNEEDDGMAMTFEDPVVRQRLTMHLSDLVHGGSKALRVNTTTDHKVRVSSYGKLYSQRGLIPHESQMRIVEDDTPWSRVEGRTTAPKQLVKLMSTALQDRGGVDPITATQSARIMYQDAALNGHGEEQFTGLRGSEAERNNASRRVTKDIMALLGFVQNDVKWLESRSLEPGKIGKSARHQLANLYRMAEVLHALPAHAKLDLRNELVLRSCGGGLRPGMYRKQRDQVVVNPKIVQHMDMMVRSTPSPGEPGANRKLADTDPESKLDRPATTLFVYRSALKGSEDIDANRRTAEANGTQKDVTKSTANYKNLVVRAENIAMHKKRSHSDQAFGASDQNQIYKSRNIGDTDVFEAMKSVAIDNKFGENRYKNRHMGRIGVKSASRRHITQEDEGPWADQVSQRENMLKKNGKNLILSQRV